MHCPFSWIHQACKYLFFIWQTSNSYVGFFILTFLITILGKVRKMHWNKRNQRSHAPSSHRYFSGAVLSAGKVFLLPPCTSPITSSVIPVVHWPGTIPTMCSCDIMFLSRVTLISVISSHLVGDCLVYIFPHSTTALGGRYCVCFFSPSYLQNDPPVGWQ